MFANFQCHLYGRSSINACTLRTRGAFFLERFSVSPTYRRRIAKVSPTYRQSIADQSAMYRERSRASQAFPYVVLSHRRYVLQSVSKTAFDLRRVSCCLSRLGIAIGPERRRSTRGIASRIFLPFTSDFSREFFPWVSRLTIHRLIFRSSGRVSLRERFFGNGIRRRRVAPRRAGLARHSNATGVLIRLVARLERRGSSVSSTYEIWLIALNHSSRNPLSIIKLRAHRRATNLRPTDPLRFATTVTNPNIISKYPRNSEKIRLAIIPVRELSAF